MLRSVSVAVLALSLFACGLGRDPLERAYPDLARHVDPMIGSRGSGNALPGPTLPHGMVKLSPDSVVPAGSIDSYEYDSPRIAGFSHTHWEGPGGSANGYGHVLVTATTGPLAVAESAYASRFDHGSELAAPGYYAVTLADFGVRAELTASSHAGLHRYSFPATTAASPARILVDVGHSRGESLGGAVEIVGADTVRGYGLYEVHPLLRLLIDPMQTGAFGVTRVYFAMRLSRPFVAFGTWKGQAAAPGERQASGAGIGAFVEYATQAGDAIEARVGISYISVEQAERNLDAEVGARGFDEVRALAVRAWNRLLSRVEVEGGTASERRRFYTALYRNFLAPADYTEDGRFESASSGHPRVVEAPWHYYTDDWCTWDTYRTTHPLLTLFEPEVVSDIVQSFVHQAGEIGWMPKCPWNATGDSRVMTANSQFCIVADAYAKGLRGFDADAAWASLRKGSMEDSANPLSNGLCGYVNQGTPPDYVSLGYVSRECDADQGASMTLEHAYDDFCVAQFAAATGRAEDARFFAARSGNWRNVFNPAHGFMQARWRDGRWVEPFDPTAPAGFTEANSWQYTWSVPHDVCGLVAAMGGEAPFLARLDAFFDGGHFAIDNEPDFHAPFLYAQAGAPWKTQALVAALRAEHFTDAPDGLPGNDDSGAMSGWFVLASLGLYPIAPGDGTYWLTTPLFDRTTLHIEPERRRDVDFVIEAQGASAGLRYIQSATLNGRPLEVPRLRHGEIVAGGKLVLVLGDAPSSWGASPTCHR